MKTGYGSKRIFRTGALVATACFWAISGTAAEKIPATILMDGRMLAESKQRILAGDKELQPAYAALLKDAAKAMQAGPFSVMNKTKIPPSGDKHDYASYARYWWPNPAKTNGLPYVQRDGQTNPESQNPDASDRAQLDDMVDGVETLGLAYYLTGDKSYADRAALLIRTWFVSPETRMNPNMKFSQGVPGKADGTKSGIIDGRVFCRALDGAILIADSSALSAEEQAALREWCSQYTNWLKTNEIAQEEANTKNNHGSFFDAQIMCFALFAGDTAFAKKVAEEAVSKRILAQIKPDGTMPEELRRTRTLHYSAFNLQALFMMAHMAESVGVDLWHAGDSRLKSSVDFLMPYADPALPWPYPDIEESQRVKILPLLLQAAVVYKDESYKKSIGKIPLADREARLENLVVPLMR